MAQQLGTLLAGQSVRIDKIEYGGSLEARRLKSGKIAFYWRYTQDQKTERVPLGTYDSSAPPRSLKPTARGFSIAAAREAARELAKQNAELPGGFRAEAVRASAAEEAEAKALTERGQFTLDALCSEYCNWLKKLGKWSHREARLLLDCWRRPKVDQLCQSPNDQTDSPIGHAGVSLFEKILWSVQSRYMPLQLVNSASAHTGRHCHN